MVDSLLQWTNGLFSRKDSHLQGWFNAVNAYHEMIIPSLTIYGRIELRRARCRLVLWEISLETSTPHIYSSMSGNSAMLRMELWIDIALLCILHHFTTLW